MVCPIIAILGQVYAIYLLFKNIDMIAGTISYVDFIAPIAVIVIVAVAVYRYTRPLEPVSYVGLLPTDYFPAEITTVGGQGRAGLQQQRYRRPPPRQHRQGTARTTRRRACSGSGCRATTMVEATQARCSRRTGGRTVRSSWKGRGKAKPVPVPERLGDPSTIKHVFLLVKENRTYDQVYGDIPQGNGDTALAQFGENVTPNQHALADQYGLYDNTYDIGTNSAEGHNWLMQADDPEYTESSAGEYLRSYDTEDDALGHQPTASSGAVRRRRAGAYGTSESSSSS